MVRKTLSRSQSELAVPAKQLEILSAPELIPGDAFQASLNQVGYQELRSRDTRILQVNLGRVCNQTCAHCHVDAGPERKEIMSRDTAQLVIDFLHRHSGIQTLDITGGAPEMNPHFRWLVEEGTRAGRRVIDRCNLTILMAPGYRDLPEFLAEHGVQVIASLPCYLEENCDAQRGAGVFHQSLAAIKKLNQLGYGDDSSELELHLVFNPIGPRLPPPQDQLEQTYRQELWNRYGIRFNRLFTITNMPINRFLDELLRQNQYLTYLQLLQKNFNSITLDQVMCRETLSVDWQGFLYDCDFNQMLDLPIVQAGARVHLSHVQDAWLAGRPIRIANHCFGCTAGSGSSCQGSLL